MQYIYCLFNNIDNKMGVEGIGRFTEAELSTLVKNIDSVRSERDTTSKIAMGANASGIIAMMVVLYTIYDGSCKGKIFASLLLTVLVMLCVAQIWCQSQLDKFFVPSNYYLMLTNDIVKLVSQVNIYSSGVILVGSLLTVAYMYGTK